MQWVINSVDGSSELNRMEWNGMGGREGVQCLLAFLDEVVLEELHALGLEVVAAGEVAAEEGAEDGDEVAVVVLEALGEAAALGVEGFELVEERVVDAVEAAVEHDAEHVVVHHELQPAADHHAGGGGGGVAADVLHHEAGLLLPPGAVLRHHLVGEEGHRHDPPHLAPVVAVHGEHHVLPLAGEDVEHHVPRPRPELHALRVEHLLGEVRAGHHHQVAHPHAEQQDVAEAPRQLHQVTVVQGGPDLQPVPDDGGARGARR
uniref:Uncharacterized protein n=1 Tax=Oryza brachyantha TaxID=4533 RepID=J3M5Z5_ORYBR